MRALEPHTTGYARNASDGVELYYEVFGEESTRGTVLCLPTWSLVHSRVWKMQVPFLVRLGHRVVTFDGRGNGRAERNPARGKGALGSCDGGLSAVAEGSADIGTGLAQ